MLEINIVNPSPFRGHVTIFSPTPPHLCLPSTISRCLRPSGPAPRPAPQSEWLYVCATGPPSLYGPANPRHQYEELTQQQYQATYGAPPRPPPHGVPTSPSTYYSGKTGPPACAW